MAGSGLFYIRFMDDILALGIFAFCGLIPAWFLSQTKRYRPEAAAAAAD